MRIGSVHIPSPLVLAPMAGGHRPGLPHHLPGAGGGLHHHRDGQRQSPVLSGQKDPPPHGAGTGGAPRRGADLRQRPGLHGGGGCHHPGGGPPGHHRHQHGLPRAQSGQQRGRLRPAAGPGQGLPGGRGGDPRGPGHPRHREDAPGLGQGEHRLPDLAKMLESVGWPPSPSTAGPRCRCTPAPPIGTTSGRSSRPSPSPSSPTGMCSPARTPPASSATPGQTG